jgi:hypothetical protein
MTRKKVWNSNAVRRAVRHLREPAPAVGGQFRLEPLRGGIPGLVDELGLTSGGQNRIDHPDSRNASAGDRHDATPNHHQPPAGQWRHQKTTSAHTA